MNTGLKPGKPRFSRASSRFLSFLCLLSSLTLACSFDASKLRAVSASKSDAVLSYLDAPNDRSTVGDLSVDGVVPPDAMASPDAAIQVDVTDDPDVEAQLDASALPDVVEEQEAAAERDVNVDDDAARTLDLATQETVNIDLMLEDASPSKFCDPVDPDLAACYRFEGNINDESSYRNHGSASNVTYVTGPAGQAVRTSTNSDIVVPGSAILNPANAITIELWVQPQTTLASGRSGLIDNDAAYGIFVHPGNAITCTVAGGSVSASSVLTNTEWTHIACVYDGANLRLYRNGSQVGKTAQTGKVSTNATGGLRIGHNNPTGDPFDGAIDGLRIWRKARSATLLCIQPSDCG